MKIGIIVSNLAVGGAEGVAFRLSKAFNQLDQVSCDLIVLNNVVEYVVEDNLIIINKKYNQSNKVINLINKIMYHGFLYKNRIKRLKHEKTYDAVISFTSLSNILNVKTKICEKTVVSLRNFYSKEVKEMNKGKVMALEHAYKTSDGIVTTSIASKNDLIESLELVEQKVVGIYNPYDIKGILTKIKNNAPESYPLMKNQNDIRIFMVARITEQKALWRGVKALSLLKEEFPNVRLYIAGAIDGSAQRHTELKQLIVSLGLENSVFLLGFREDVHQLMSEMDIFLLSSKWEGFPNALVEAMICSLAVVATDCDSGPREIMLDTSNKVKFNTSNYLTTDLGILVKQLSLEKFRGEIMPVDVAIAEGLRYILRHENYKTSVIKNGKKRVESFSLMDTANQWKYFIDDL